MTRITRSVWWLIVLGVFTIALTQNREVQAASIIAAAKGITITGSGGSVPGTDPYFFYEFDVSVAPNYQLDPGQYFQFQNVPGITPGGVIPGFPSGSPVTVNSAYSAYFGYPTITLTGNPTPASNPPYPPNDTYTSNIEWQNTGPSILGGSSGTYIGSFLLYTSVSLTSLPQTVIYYALSTDSTTGDPYFQGLGGNGPPGIIFLTVPEPTSAVLLVASAIAVPLFVIHKRQRC
jgi:hypothetical protein